MTDKKDTKPVVGLELLRKPFSKDLISKLPKPTRKQTDEVRANFKAGIRCKVCGGWHHKDVVHLDYVGHAALTDRLLDCDPLWNWEPVAVSENGLPMIENGGMWIRLTVCGQTRLGYGDADGKTGGNAIKEIIGDALRNAAMRFGAALDLWHKGDLHADDEPEQQSTVTPEQFTKLRDGVEATGTDETKFLNHFKSVSLEQFPADKYADAVGLLDKKLKQAESKTDHPELGGDEIPY